MDMDGLVKTVFLRQLKWLCVIGYVTSLVYRRDVIGVG